MTSGAVQRVLSGRGFYDTISEGSQAIVRSSWDERIAVQLGSLDLAEELRAAGDPWIEAAIDGSPVVRNPRPASA